MTHCPACGQPLPKPNGRICGICNKTIGTREKWHIVGSMVQHRNCENPELTEGVQSAQTSFIAPQRG